ncbi:15781_t:CDS:2 [Cetraspora pellucida]|uniref:15781_t:CDS:1 n=1 Tax=Cetraspora pellucida TaxID=1433469 RepID=A0A9N9G0N0_9GLOM|nr:15781_t:CDS:2 [Cetraspora pellucida]
MYQKEEGWGPKPTNPPIPWGKEASKCNWCSVNKKYCYCGSITDWNWDDVEYKNYKWCRWCQKTNHNTNHCWDAPKLPKIMSHEPKLPEVTSQEWKEKFKCLNCSKRCRVVYHDEGKQCPKTYPYSDSRHWNNDWWKTDL